MLPLLKFIFLQDHLPTELPTLFLFPFMKHIFGPVNSRRLGRSLGIDLLGKKVCSLNCIYCEIGKASHLTTKREEYVAVEHIVEELDSFFLSPEAEESIDVVTVTANGEPTLHGGLGEILSSVKKFTKRPVIVLTNSTMLHSTEVREALCFADIVMPSLDSARPESFRKVNRPAPGVDVKQIIEALISFTTMFKGEVWLEVLLVAGINDTEADVIALVEAIRQIKPSRVQLNTVARPPLLEYAKPLSQGKMDAVATHFRSILDGIPVDVLVGVNAQPASVQSRKAEKKNLAEDGELVGRITQTLQRRPCTANDIRTIFQIETSEKVTELLEPLVAHGCLEKKHHGQAVYYRGNLGSESEEG